MYIIYETIASNDPRKDDRIIKVGDFWHYTISYIAPADEANVHIDWLKGTAVSEKLAKANKFITALEGEVPLINKDFKSYDEIMHPTSGGDNDYVKQIYFLKPEDDDNARDLLKEVMRNQIRNYITGNTAKNPAGTDQLLARKVDGVKNLKEAQYIMKVYFGVNLNAYTQSIKDIPEFDVNW